MRELDRIGGIEDLDERARMLAAFLRDVQAAEPAATRMRTDLVRELRGRGRSHQEVADLLGIARSTAQQIAEGKQTGRRRPPPVDESDEA